MSTSVKSSPAKVIAKATKDLKVTEKEISKVIKEVGPKLTQTEAKKLADLWDVTDAKKPWATVGTTGKKAKLDATAKKAFLKFAADKQLPIGPKLQKAYADAINEQFSRIRLGAPSKEPPRSMRNLISVDLRADSDPRISGRTKHAHIDVVKKEYVVMYTSFDGRGAHSSYHGPFALPELKQKPTPAIDPQPSSTGGKLSRARVETFRGIFRDALSTTTKRHQSLPVGSRFERAELMHQKHPDGYTWSVLVPVGALSPAATRKDPNKVDAFWVQQSGGIAGRTEYAGPFSLRDIKAANEERYQDMLSQTGTLNAGD